MRVGVWKIALTAFLAVLAIVISVGFIAIEEWWAPREPWQYVGGIVLAVFGLFAAFWFWATRAEKEAGSEEVEALMIERLSGLILLLVFGFAALGISAVWESENARAWALEHLAAEESGLMARALDDPSTKVRRVACKSLFEYGLAPFESRLHAALDPDPDAAYECLQHAAEIDAKGHRVIATRLVYGWQTAMMRADSLSSSKACEVAQYMPEMAAIAETKPGESALLQCALSADREEVRACCGETLATRGKLLDHFDNPEALPAEDAARIFTEMVLLAFEPDVGDETAQKTASELEMSTEDGKEFVVRVGCELFEAGFKREVVRGFVPVLESDACNLNEETQLFFSAVEPWPVLCDEMARKPATGDVEGEMCERIQRTVQDAAIKRASNILSAATRAMYLEAVANTLETNLGFVASSKRREDPNHFSNIEIIRFYEKKDVDHIMGRRVPRACYSLRNDMMNAHRRGGIAQDELQYDIDPRGCVPEGLDRDRTLEDRVRDDFGAIADIQSGRAFSSEDQPNRGNERESTRLRERMRQKYGKGAYKAGERRFQKEMKRMRGR